VTAPRKKWSYRWSIRRASGISDKTEGYLLKIDGFHVAFQGITFSIIDNGLLRCKQWLFTV
jgi:hypothetical protein